MANATTRNQQLKKKISKNIYPNVTKSSTILINSYNILQNGTSSTNSATITTITVHRETTTKSVKRLRATKEIKD